MFLARRKASSLAAQQTLQIVLRSHPGIGNPVTPHIFQTQSVPANLDNTNQPLSPGKIKLETIALSVDPFMRCMLDPSHPQLGEYLDPFALGEPLHGGGVGVVTESQHDHFPVQSLVVAPFLGYPWQTKCVLDANDVDLNLRTVSLTHRPTLDLGALGMPGVTSWFCMLEAGKPKPTDTVVISGAAGACGSLAGQLAKKVAGAKRVVGICGSHTKGQLLTESFGFDAAVNYRSSTFGEELRNACPDGIDVFMDNVGGDVAETTLPLMNTHGRVPICGQIASYNEDVKYTDIISDTGVQNSNTRQMLKDKKVQRQRFLVLDYAADFEAAAMELAALVMQNKIVVPETISTGFDVGGAFCNMMAGGNVGKALVVVHPDYTIGGKCWVDDGTTEMKSDACGSGSGSDVVWRW